LISCVTFAIKALIVLFWGRRNLASGTDTGAENSVSGTDVFDENVANRTDAVAWFVVTGAVCGTEEYADCVVVCANTGTVARTESGTDCHAGGFIANATAGIVVVTMKGANSYADCVVASATDGTVGVLDGADCRAGVFLAGAIIRAGAGSSRTDVGTDVPPGNVAGGARADDLTGLADGFVGANPSSCAGAKSCAVEGMTCTWADADIALADAVTLTATDTDLASCRSLGPAWAGVNDTVGSTCFHF